MRVIFSAIAILTLQCTAFSQQVKPITIDECYTLAQQYYPLSKQRELISKSKDFSIENASKGYLPQVNFGGQATHQSDVTKVPISLPNMNIPTISKDQYKVFGEINQPLTDVFVIKDQKELIATNAIIEEQKLEVELYKLKERINQLFFGTLLMNEQLNQMILLKKDIQSGIDNTNAALQNGVALKSSLDMLKSELLKADQRTIELKAARKAYLDMLGLFINQKLDDATTLENPAEQSVPASISRPEMLLFDTQAKVFDSQNKLITAKNLPHVSLFFQEGYGRPALNMLSNTPEFYYIGGLRFNWSLSGLYTMHKERLLLDINRDLLNTQKETFLFNTNMALQQQESEISKLKELIKIDADIVALRESVKNSANNQLENGVITANDYLREVNAEDQSKQNLLLHKVQLLSAQYNFKTTSGN